MQPCASTERSPAEISTDQPEERLLKQWTEAYARTLRPKLVLGRYRTGRTGWWEELAPHRYDLQLGGEVAAARITGYLRPGTVTLYGKKAEPPLLLDYQLRPDPAGPVEFVKRFWAFETDDEAVVPLPLIYADLLMLGDARCLETAELNLRANFGWTCQINEICAGFRRSFATCVQRRQRMSRSSSER